MNRRPLRHASGGTAKWCAVNGIDPGDSVEVEYRPGEWSKARVTAFGESEILVRRSGAAEYALDGRRIRKPTR